MEFRGEISALLSSASWAFSSFVFQSSMDKFSPIMLNFVKGMISMVLIFSMIIFLGSELFPSVDVYPYACLALSGIFGITLGDSLYFKALNELGPRKALVLETLATPFTGFIAFVFYGTTIPFIGWIGILVTLIGLYIVVTDSQGGHSQSNTSCEKIQPQAAAFSSSLSCNNSMQQTAVLIPMKNLSSTGVDIEKNCGEPSTISQALLNNDELILTGSLSKRRSSIHGGSYQSKMQKIFSSGLIYGIVGMFCQSLGMVLAHSALQHTPEFEAVSATMYRLLASMLLLLPIIKFSLRESFEWPQSTMKENGTLFLGILLGNFLSVLLQQVSLEYTRPEVSQTLIATSPLFALIFGRIKGEHISQNAIWGSIIAVVGVAVIVFA